jgi:hypothetical protein
MPMPSRDDGLDVLPLTTIVRQNPTAHDCHRELLPAPSAVLARMPLTAKRGDISAQ